MAQPQSSERMEKIVSLCKRRGFIFQSSEIYGGINGFWDYGPLGAELKRNVKDYWWRSMTREREDVAGLDATIVMHPRVWEASGHTSTFSDPMVDCKTCKARFRADQLAENPCPRKPSKPAGGHVECQLTEARKFNLMFKTYVGPVEDAENTAYLRPETAQAIFAQFKTVLEVSRQKVPFGIAQIGKAFRNEINPRNFTFRSREFEQMELEFFIRPDEAVEAINGRVATAAEIVGSAAPAASGHGPAEAGAPNRAPASDLPSQADWGWEAWHKYWVEQRLRFYEAIGLPRVSLEEYWQKKDELAHYARACVDILYQFPFGTQELEGIAARSDFDLSQHQRFSGKSMAVFDDELKAAWPRLDEAKRTELSRRYFEARRRYLVQMGAPEEQADPQAKEDAANLAKGSYVPHVIEPSAGVDRLVLALICNAYSEDQAPDEKGKMETRVVMRFHPRIAPIKVAVLPLLKNRPELVAKAREIRDRLRPHLTVFYDEAGAIGRRYRRQDEAGTPFGVTVDFETLGEKGPELKETVTLRERDSMKQERVKIEVLLPLLLEKIR